MGICAALFHRAQTGRGQEIHVSLLQSALELLSDKVMREPVHDSMLRDPLMDEIHAKQDSGAPYDQVAAVRKAQAPRFASHRLFYGGYHTKRGALVLGALTMQNRNTIRDILDIDDPTDLPGFNAAEPESRLIEEWRERIQQRLLERPADEWVALFPSCGSPGQRRQPAGRYGR